MNNFQKKSFFKQPAFGSFMVLFLAWLFFFWPSIRAIFLENNLVGLKVATYGITVSAFYLLYLQRKVLESALLTSSQLGLVALFLLAIGLVLGEVFHLSFVVQAAVTLMLPAIVMTTFGPVVIRAFIFPLLYLMLIIPLQDNALNYRAGIVFVAIVFFIFYWRSLKKGILLPEAMDILPWWALQNFRWFTPTLIAFSILMASPWLGDNIRDFRMKARQKITLRAPLAMGGWTGPLQIKNPTLQALYPNASSTLQVEYLPIADAESIYLYSAYYDSDRAVSDMLNPTNSIFDPALWKTARLATAHVNLAKNNSVAVFERVLEGENSSRLVWYWYYSAGVSTIDPNMRSLLDTVRVISKYAQGSGMIMLSTPFYGEPSDARRRLTAFLSTMYGSLDTLKRPEALYP